MPVWGVTPSIRVRDTKASVAFYAEKLGFEIRRQADDNSALDRGDAHIMIEGALDFYGPEYNAAIRERMGALSANALYMEAKDLDELYARVLASGLKVMDPLAARAWGQSEFTVEDPDGNWVTFWRAPA